MGYQYIQSGTLHFEDSTGAVFKSNEGVSPMDINIHEFFKRFQEKYDFLYEHDDRAAGYYEALSFGNDFIKTHSDFVKKFNAYRQDILSSDREVAAFALALFTYMD